MQAKAPSWTPSSRDKSDKSCVKRDQQTNYLITEDLHKILQMLKHDLIHMQKTLPYNWFRVAVIVTPISDETFKPNTGRWEQTDWNKLNWLGESVSEWSDKKQWCRLKRAFLTPTSDETYNENGLEGE